jgi:hypothetical protein
MRVSSLRSKLVTWAPVPRGGNGVTTLKRSSPSERLALRLQHRDLLAQFFELPLELGIPARVRIASSPQGVP